MKARHVTEIVVTVLIIVAAMAMYPLIDSANRDAALKALSDAGYDHVEIGERHVFGGCLNGKGGTRYRYDWTASRRGKPHVGTVCAGGVFIRSPSIEEGR